MYILNQNVQHSNLVTISLILSIKEWSILRNQIFLFQRLTEYRFTKGKSYLTNLLSFYGKVTHSTDEEKVMNVVFLYFRNTFDSVPHSILQDNLSSCGMSGCRLCWVKNWPKGTAQRGPLVTSGAPQGSILGRVLVNTFTNNLQAGVKSTISTFADDSKLRGGINSK